MRVTRVRRQPPLQLGHPLAQLPVNLGERRELLSEQLPVSAQLRVLRAQLGQLGAQPGVFRIECFHGQTVRGEVAVTPAAPVQPATIKNGGPKRSIKSTRRSGGQNQLTSYHLRDDLFRLSFL